MKTLNEVIKNLEDGTEHLSAMLISRETWSDALHYLKNYRDTKKWLDLEKRNYAEAVKNCERPKAKYTQMILDMNRNGPLTWDELKQMEGKPVWVVRTEKYCVPHWAIVDKVYKWDSIDDSSAILQPEDEELFLSDQGKTWQAYRKERE